MLPIAPVAAHEPDDTWSCHGGEPTSPGDCYRHWPDANRDWHFTDGPPDAVKAAILRGRDEIVSGHTLTAPRNPSDNKVHWDTSCQVACVTRFEYEPVDHIVGFQIHFQSGLGWNTLANSSHGSFVNLDLWAVAVHEWGHAAGLGHSSTGAGHDCTGSSNVNTNFATMTQGRAGCLNNGHTEQRSLHQHDLFGRCQVYNHAHGYGC